MRIGDPVKCEEEVARLTSMNNLLNLAGFPEHVYIDFAEETYELLNNLSKSLRTGRAAEFLLTSFNDESVSMSIITHVKVCACRFRTVNVSDHDSCLRVPSSSRDPRSTNTGSLWEMLRPTVLTISKLPCARLTISP